MTTLFQKGEKVVSTTNEQGLVSGRTYEVVDISTQTVLGSDYTNYFVRESAESPVHPVVNGHLLLKRPEPPKPPVKTVMEKIVDAHEAIITLLQGKGADLEFAPVSRVDYRTKVVTEYRKVKTVGGECVYYEISAAYSSSSSSYISRETGAIRATVGNYGSRVSYPEGKDGLNVEKIAQRLLDQCNDAKTMRRQNAEREVARARVDAKKIALAETVKSLNGGREPWSISEDKEPRAFVDSAGELRIELKVRVTVEQAEQLKALVASFATPTATKTYPMTNDAGETVRVTVPESNK